jgi:hypothetical protein
MGEKFVVDVERQQLRQAGRDDLARKVDLVAETIGDGLGFDVLSFEEVDESERYVEVKTTGLGIYFPFYVTANEVRCSEDMAVRYYLYRVFDFSRAPKVYVLKGALSKTCQLRATQFLATNRGAPRTGAGASPRGARPGSPGGRNGSCTRRGGSRACGRRRRTRPPGSAGREGRAAARRRRRRRSGPAAFLQ